MLAGSGAKRLAVVGQPVAHSLSPRMQTAALEATGLAGKGWSYGALEVASEEFAERVGGLAEQGYIGVNVTIPHKLAALELADEASERALQIGAANTLSFTDAGVVADNTDAPGLLATLPGDLGEARALVLGAGGAARAVVWALRSAGARVEIVNRTRARADEMAVDLGGEVITPAQVALQRVEILVNTTSIGLESARRQEPGADAELKLLGINADQLGDQTTVVDMVYGEKPTYLAEAAKKAGAEVIDGQELLIQQGAVSFEIWTSRPAPIDSMRAAIASPL